MRTTARLIRCGAVVLPLLLCSSLTAQDQGLREIESAGRKALRSRLSEQQTFLIERNRDQPPASKDPKVILEWIDAAEAEWAERCPSRNSRRAALSPYLWSWLPHWLAGGAEDPVYALTHADRHLPALLADIEAVVERSEPGVGALLRRQDLANVLYGRTLATDVDITMLRRFHSQVGRLGEAMRRIRQESKDMRLDMPEHLYQAVGELQRFSKSVKIEIDLRTKRYPQAFIGLSSVAVAGRIPPGFRDQATRLARAYAESDQVDVALAVLDLAALSASGADWSDREMRELYEEIAETRGRIRFWTVADRRPFALIPSKTKFDPKRLIDLETGEPLTDEQLKDRILVLVFWSRTCQPCLGEIPHLQEFAAEHAKHVLLVGVVSGDSGDYAADVKAVRDRGGRYPVVGELARGKGEKAFAIHGTPSYIVVRQDRIVLKPFGDDSSPTYSFADVESTVIRMVRGEMR